MLLQEKNNKHNLQARLLSLIIAAHTMTNLSRTTRNCPGSMQLELLCLEEGLNDEDRKRSQMHLQQCGDCRQTSKELDTFYAILTQEMRRTINNSSFDFTKRISSDKVQSGHLICEPLPQMNNGHGQAFRTKLNIDVPRETDDEKIDAVSFRSLKKHSLVIRFMTDSVSSKLILALWSLDTDDFHGWVLHIPGVSESVRFNSAGLAKIPQVNLERLDDKVIYLGFDMVPSPNESRLQKIIKSMVS